MNKPRIRRRPTNAPTPSRRSATTRRATAQGTTPGSFANQGRVGTPWTFSSPDTPGMPQPSEKTAWDFLPEDWEVEIVGDESSGYASSPCEACAAARVFTDSLGVTRR